MLSEYQQSDDKDECANIATTEGFVNNPHEVWWVVSHQTRQNRGVLGFS